MYRINFNLEKIIPSLNATFYIEEDETKLINNEMRESLIIDGLNDEEIIEQKNIALAEIVAAKIYYITYESYIRIKEKFEGVNKLFALVFEENKTLYKFNMFEDYDKLVFLCKEDNEDLKMLGEINEVIADYISTVIFERLNEYESRSAKINRESEIYIEYDAIKLKVRNIYGSYEMDLYFSKEVLGMSELDFATTNDDMFKEKFKEGIKNLIKQNLSSVIKCLNELNIIYQKTKEESKKNYYSDFDIKLNKNFTTKIFNVMKEQGLGYKVGDRGWYEFDDSPTNTKRTMRF